MASFQHFFDHQGEDLGFIIGSPLCGSPISIKVKAMSLPVPAGSVLTFHRVMVEVKAGLSGLSNGEYITQQFMAAVESGEVVEMDISSALRSVADNYEYTPDATTYPRIKFQVKAWDVYRIDGDVKDRQEEVILPDANQYYYALLGKYNDLERIMAGSIKLVKDFCNKPSSPQIVCVGENFAYTPSFTGNEGGSAVSSFKGYSFNDMPVGPTSQTVIITREGYQNIGNTTVYALSAIHLRDRFQFRFINHLGVLDSYSCYSLEEQGNDIVSEAKTLAERENFNTFSRGIMRKLSDKEWIKLTAGSLDRDWLDWLRHEFLMAEHVWLYVPFTESTGTWLRCLIETEDSINAINRHTDTPLSLNIKVRLDINGTINPHIAV